ncbi:MAG: hypothetical protein AAF065_00720 [Verrucomicrobiota bacterium]
MKYTKKESAEPSIVQRTMLLVLSLLVATTQVLGAQANFEIEYCHSGDSTHAPQSHSHEHAHGASHSSHSGSTQSHHHKQTYAGFGCDHGGTENEESTDDKSNGCHAHIVTLSVDMVCLHPAYTVSIKACRISGCHAPITSAKCPEGPCFDLIKPPQLV